MAAEEEVAWELEAIRALSLEDRDEEALTRCRALAAKLAPDVSVNLRAHVWSTLAQMLLHEERYDEALAAADQGLGEPKLTDFFAERAELLRSRSAALAALGREEDARAVLADAVRIFQGKGDVHRAAGAYTAVQVALWNRGRLEEAIRVGEEGLRAARAVEATRALAALAHNQSLILVERGDLEGALARAQEALATGEKLGEPGRIGYAHWNLAYVHGQRGDLVEAEAAFQQALRLAEQENDSFGIAFATKGIGEAVYRQGRTEEGRAILEDARTRFASLAETVDPLTGKDNVAMIDAILRGGGHWTA